MRKVHWILMAGLVLVVLVGLAGHQVNTVSAQGSLPVGVVVAYTPGQSITIVDQDGHESVYTLDASLKIQPPGRASSLEVGSFVTIIAPASLSNGKQTAVGIVVHPEVPNGWKVPVWTSTPVVDGTATLTAFPDTPTPGASETATPPETATAIPVETLTQTPTPFATAKDDGATGETNSFIEWLMSLFQQTLGR